MGLFGFFGNCVTTWLLWADRRKSATFFLLFAIVVCDLLYVFIYLTVISIPGFGIKNTFGRSSKQMILFSLLQYLFIGPLQAILTVKLYLTTAVSFHRYLSTCHPFKAKTFGSVRIAVGQLLVSIFICILVWMPFMVDFTIGTAPNGYPTRVPILYGDTYVLFKTILHTLFLNIVPFIMLGIFSVLLLRGLKIAYRNQAGLTGNSNKERKERQSFCISLMTGVMMVVVAINQSLVPIRQLLNIFFDYRTTCDNVFFYYDPWVGNISILSASISTFLYVPAIEKHKAKLLNLFKRNNVGPVGVSTLHSNSQS
jgi:hypothetical protein